MRDRAKARGHATGTPGVGKKEQRAARPMSEARLLADARKSQREGRLTAQRRAVRLRVAAVVAIVAVVVGGLWALYSSSLFPVETVEVVGNSHVSADAVRALARVSATATLIRFPADQVAQRVEADPWVASASVSRVFPTGMRIRITERVPVAIVEAGATSWLVDVGGMVIAKPTTETSATLPVVQDVPGLDLKAGRRTVSEPLINALRVLTGISPELESTVRSVSAPSVDGATLLTAARVEITFGQAIDLSTKDAEARQILSDQKGKVVSIDVRSTDRPTWRGLK